MQFYIYRDQERYGPYGLEEVNAYLSNGSILETDKAWWDGLQDCVSVKEIPGVVLQFNYEEPTYSTDLGNDEKRLCINCNSTLTTGQIICIECGSRQCEQPLVSPHFRNDKLTDPSAGKDEVTSLYEKTSQFSIGLLLSGVAWSLGDHFPESAINWGVPAILTVFLHIALGIGWVMCGYLLFNHVLGVKKYLGAIVLPVVFWFVGSLGTDPLFAFLFDPGLEYNFIVKMCSYIFIIIWAIPYIIFPFVSDSILNMSIFCSRKLIKDHKRKRQFRLVVVYCLMGIFLSNAISYEIFDFSLQISETSGIPYYYARIIIFIISTINTQRKMKN